MPPLKPYPLPPPLQAMQQFRQDLGVRDEEEEEVEPQDSPKGCPETGGLQGLCGGQSQGAHSGQLGINMLGVAMLKVGGLVVCQG